jgi:uncharacterized Zn-binding protein involved in type VI secretion
MSKIAALSSTLNAPQGKAVATLARASDSAQRQRERGDASSPAPGAANDGATPAPAAPSGGVAHAILSSAPMKMIGRGFNFMTSVEQALSSSVFGKIPFPAMPAVTIGASGFGLPHAHAHPPNLIPPASPIPFPHLTSLLSIPILSGASNTMVGGKPAARCGDMGVSVWCGGYFPLCEVFLGSATVWIEGARAARVGVDITKHCIFTTPKPSDPPIGPMVGMTVEPDRSVMIGGVPMPSLTSLVMGGAFKLAFKGAGAVGRVIGGTRAGKAVRAKVTHFRATRAVDRLVKKKLLLFFPDNGTPGFQKAARADFIEIAKTPVGRQMFDDLLRHKKPVHVHPPAHHQVLMPGWPWPGPYAATHDVINAQYKVVADANGDLVRRWDNGLPTYPPDRVRITGPGKGSGTDIVYDPTGQHPNSMLTPGSPSHAVAGHELQHAVDNAAGRNGADLAKPDPAWQQAWQDLGEHNAVEAFEKPYRAAKGLPPRPDYRAKP